MWDHTAVAAESKLVVSLVVGKRTYEQTQALVQDARHRLQSWHLPAIFTDAYEGDETAILEALGRRYPAPCRGRKGCPARPQVRWPHGLAYGQVKKIYKGSRIEAIEVRAMAGKARLTHVLSLLGYQHITTSVVERHNGPCRQRNRRKVRKTLAFSKASRYHRWMSWLSVTLYNFCRSHGSLKVKYNEQVRHRSPAMAAGLADHIWFTREWLLWPVLGG
jgi:IS1 family transposase